LSRKEFPIATGLLDYFPNALLEVARLSKVCNNQHNPDMPLQWSREKSQDHPDALLRHLIDRGKLDTDGMRHTAKVAWRALALLQIELENDEASIGQGHEAAEDTKRFRRIPELPYLQTTRCCKQKAQPGTYCVL